MKNRLIPFLIGAATVLVLGAAATKIQYGSFVGVFSGLGTGITNASGTSLNSVGSAGFSNAISFLHASMTNQPLSQITNAGTIAYSNATAFMSAANATTNSNGLVVIQGGGVYFSLNATGNGLNEKYYRWYVGADKFQLQRKTDDGATVLAIPILITNDMVQFDEGVIAVSTNTLANWPPAPYMPGSFAIVNSNGFPYILLSTNGNGGGMSVWTATNKLGW